MQQADLSLARQSSSQAALAVADIVLREETPEAVLTVLKEGQQIVNGTMDVLRLSITQLIYLTLLIPMVLLALGSFPYRSVQGSIISVVTQTLPAVGLGFFAASGLVRTGRMRRMLAWFTLPPAAAISIAGLVVFTILLRQTGDDAYAQLGLTHMLIYSGLVLVILARPPVKALAIEGSHSGDWRPTVLVLVLLVLFVLLASLPISEEWFLVRHLDRAEDYGIVGLAVAAWVVVVLAIWKRAVLRQLVRPIVPPTD
jgi:cation-transporting ATPase E